ncbi:MAG: SDR family NAD(P)-dependent oxidoreductase [Deltaproteobacteria bacterium]|jgi:NAD(P)-dependent dehydrogenase (short-subunit alcohol dehydrogenase family)|nr:SDR family NAD(P)-dependent oxidoreductase [Deltaproteobacteria bacterium]MBT4263090.1 SDR family NAD(P)-dependent oxidoreductase [Deltaproteobacteria bacterium]MBT4643441.1 SDR family NAD(P)-dependent oxidoreductase [Deltaproteobacteria bacterium]MBT6502490.1 SDR family NAD(P)-dependent oxidoreductase [Deltaproteobacteria bacterium]MBT6614666.1 SDR family NAD(P)-dependent oxidoreductase [Deltaproteobacteria bacterium]
MLELKGKTVFITGGAEGIGYHIGRRLAHAGMNIMLSDIDTTVLDKAVKTLKKEGFNAEGVKCDVSIPEDLESAAQKTIDTFGKVHMLINNAGVGASGPQQRIKENDWRWMIDVNLMGVVTGTQVFVPLIQSHGEGGWLINVASMAGFKGESFAGPYSATKAAVVSLSETWRSELGPSGINVSVLCPGYVKSRIYDSMRNRQECYGGPVHFEQILRKNPKLSILKEPVVTGIDTEIVGHRVLEALANDEFYIFTHPEIRDLVNMQFNNITEGFDQADASPVLDTVLPKESPNT